MDVDPLDPPLNPPVKPGEEDVGGVKPKFEREVKAGKQLKLKPRKK